jgi:hypothetical protein
MHLVPDTTFKKQSKVVECTTSLIIIFSKDNIFWVFIVNYNVLFPNLLEFFFLTTGSDSMGSGRRLAKKELFGIKTF